MTIFANIGCLDVSRVFANCIRAVVTTKAVTGDIHVVEIRRYPANCAVAVIAIVTTRNMGRVLAGGSDAIVTGCAGSNDLGVIDYYHGLPHCCGVTVFTDVCRQGVRWTLARSVRAVMAVYAVAGDGSMVESCR